MNITPSEVYWVMQMDSILTPLYIINVVAIAFCVISAVIYFFLLSDDEAEAIIRRSVSGVALCSLVVIFFTLPLCMFLPDTKTLAAVKLIPAITNGEAMQRLSEDGKEIYHLGIEKIKQELKGETK